MDTSVIEAIETGFSELTRGNALIPPIMMIPLPEKMGQVDIKVASGFFESSRLGLPSQSGQMLVVSA